MVKTLIFATAGKWQVPGIIESNTLGAHSIAIDADINAVGFNHAHKIITVKDINDLESISSQILKMGFVPSGVISYCSEAGQLLASHLRGIFKLPGDNNELTYNFIEKSRQRKIWKNVFLEKFNWQVFKNKDLALKYLSRQTSLQVVKPDIGSGSRGVGIIDSTNLNSSELMIQKAFDLSKNKKIIIEDYFPGTEYTVDSFSINGEAHILLIAKKEKVSSNLSTVSLQLEALHPTAPKYNMIRETVNVAINALGKYNGPAHSEVIINEKNEIHIIESASRGGGFNLASVFIPQVTGVNYARLCVQDALGIKVVPSEVTTLNKKYGILRFFVSEPGKVVKIQGLEDANNINGIYAESFTEVGNIVSAATSDADRLGCIISVDNNEELMKKNLDEALGIIKFHVE